MNNARILIVEDRPLVAQMLEICLRKLGHEIVATTASGDETMIMAGKLRPDLVLIDINVSSGFDGIETSRLLRKNFAIPSVFLTGHAGGATSASANTTEPFGFLVKPFEEFELQTMLGTALHLRAVEARLLQFSRAVEQSPASIVITDLRGCIEYVNPRFTEITGYTSAEAIGQNPRVLKSGAQPVEYYRDLWETIVAGRDWQGEFCNRKKNGELYWELASISPIRNDAGQITHFVGVKEDITARKQTEDTLRESEARYRTLIENLGEGIGVVDLQEQFLFANPASERIFSVPDGGLVGRSLREFTEPGQFNKIAQETRLRQTGATNTYEIEIICPDGGKRTLLVTAVPQHDRQGQFISTFGVFRDITERKQAEMQSLQSRIQLEDANAQLTAAIVRERELAVAADAANRAKSTFLASMSHELRSPLNVINGVAATLIEQTADAGQKQSLHLVLESGENLLGIIEEILDYSGLQAGQPRIEAKSFELLGIVAQVLRLAAEGARRKKIGLGFSIAGGLPACVVSDPRRLKQVLLNLVNNAVKFTDRGRVHLHCSARLGSPGRWLLSFAVSDTGPGLSPAELARLFQPFVRGSGPGVAQSSGSGLGLVISRTYANLLGGDIAVRSRPGRGSVFRCTIGAGAIGSSVTALTAIAPVALQGRPVLIVVEDHRQRRFLAATARAWKLQATVCTGAAVTAATLEAAGPFALAILDPEAVRNRSGELFRWLAPGAPGHTVPVAWLHRCDPHRRPETAAASLTLPYPIELGELARAISRLAGAAGAPPAAPAANGSARRAALGERIPLRILAADDIRTNREMLRLMMGHLGYKLTTVENGAEVLAAMQQHPFDLILLDVQMPVMDGRAVAREIRRLQPDPARRPKLVAITASALPGDREECLAVGMDDYLSKPLLPSDIETCILRLFQPRPFARVGGAPRAEPSAAEAPWVDRAHLESVVHGMTPDQAADMLTHLHETVAEDFRQIRPRVIAACEQKDPRRLAELMHGLKGCFLTLGWVRVARRCIEVLDQARKGEFAAWDTFPAELEELLNRSTAGMTDYLATIKPFGGVAERPEAAAEADRTSVRPSSDGSKPRIPVNSLVESDSGEDGGNAGAVPWEPSPTRK